ncbi:hypothetical protein [Candidatus Borreliella tachyglossi]|uniref:hypothetical protein n=1 Tax=Candidatus Borreliella tachyglossi TaxID=1964448 RepID=UPI0040420ECE
MKREDIRSYLSLNHDVNVAKRLEQVTVDSLIKITHRLDRICSTTNIKELSYKVDRIKKTVEVVVAVTFRLNNHLLLVRDKFIQEIDTSSVIQIVNNVLD